MDLCTLYIIRLAGLNIRTDLKASFILNSFFKCQPLTFSTGFELSLATQNGHFKQVNEHSVAFVYTSHPLPFTALADSDVSPFSLGLWPRLTKIFAATWERFVARESLETSVIEEGGKKRRAERQRLMYTIILYANDVDFFKLLTVARILQ